MKETNTHSFYTSPKVKVIDVLVNQLVCTSPGTEKYEYGTWNN